MRSFIVCLLLAGCAQAPVLPPASDLFRDALFGAPSQRIDAEEIFALSEPMQRYVDDELAVQRRSKGVHLALVDAITQGQLRLKYDSVMTRTAAQAFEARSGNCLSLAIITAAFAKALNMNVYFNVADGDLWGRASDLYFLNAHVNVSLARRMSETRNRYDVATLMTIDFLPGSEITGLRTREIDERTIVAMFMNNRAVEALVDGRLDDGYWSAREGVRQDAAFMPAYNTLGVIYLRRDEPALAEQVFNRVRSREPGNTRMLANLVVALGRLGRPAEAALVEGELTRIERHAPFYFFQRGLAAVEAGDYVAARALFQRELDRSPDYHEFHFWLGLVELKLGNVERAREQVAAALENSTTRHDHDLYAAKLQRLAALRR